MALRDLSRNFLKCFLLLGMASVSCLDAQAQVIPVYSAVYRPPGVRYLVMRSAHFDVIYQEGTEDQARELAAVLEGRLPEVSRIFPTSDNFRMPFVLNRFSQRGNGFVTPIPFHSEIDGVALFGRSLSPRHSDWLSAVAPHELVHAAQGAYSGGFGLSSLIRPFAPDMAKALNLWTPPGIAEGAAVYLESSIEKGAGRLNHPWFTMQYQAAVGAGRPWTLAQMLENPRYVRPGDRFYKGGAALMESLADSSGNIPALSRATAFHNRFPFLGYGLSFWYGTRTFPRSLGRDLRRKAVQKEASRVAALGALTESRLVTGHTGQVVRRPRWLDTSTVLAYLTDYDRRRGLYTIDVESGKLTAVAHHELTEDLQFSLSPDSGSALAARYVRAAIASSQTFADVFRIDLETGKEKRLTRRAGLLSPVEIPDGRLWAIQLDGAFSNWVVGTPEGGFEPVVEANRTRFVQLEPSPDFSSVAVILNRSGHQGLYLSDAARPRLDSAVSFADASVFDVTWSPDGEWLLFSADPSGVLNLFAYGVRDRAIRQLTNVVYGAVEPAVSPDGSQLAFTEFQDQRFDLRVMPFRPQEAPLVDFPLEVAPDRGASIDTTGIATLAGPYKSLRHMRPRMLYPTAYYEEVTSSGGGSDLGVGIGLALQGTDPLSKWSYWGEGFFQGGRPWGEVGITSAITALRPSLRLYRRPDQLLAQLGNGPDAEISRVIRDERGIEFGVQTPILLRDNIHRSTANLGFFVDLQENRLLGGDDTVVRDWTRRTTVTPVASFGIGLQSNLRSLWPSRGATLFSLAEFEFVPTDFGGAGTSFFNELDVYLPFLSRINNGLKLELASISQTRGFVFDTDFFMPRGHENRAPQRGTFVRVGAETIQPVLYPENGMLIVPWFVHAVYLYGFAERLSSAEDLNVQLTSVGGGVGIQFSILHVMELDLRWGRAYRTGDSPDLGWTTVFR
jgi:WD40-like Beta Propeller Repeat